MKEQDRTVGECRPKRTGPCRHRTDIDLFEQMARGTRFDQMGLPPGGKAVADIWQVCQPVRCRNAMLLRFGQPARHCLTLATRHDGGVSKREQNDKAGKQREQSRGRSFRSSVWKHGGKAPINRPGRDGDDCGPDERQKEASGRPQSQQDNDACQDEA